MTSLQRAVDYSNSFSLVLRWVKASYRWSGYDFGLGGEEFGSG